jgi:3-oxoadipate enol-lactonase
MPFVQSHGRDIYYETHGTGAPLLMLHGAGSNAATWWQQLPTFSRTFKCITMDIRCFGRSAAPTAEFLLPNFVDDAIAVLDAAQAPQAVVLGQSLGGMVGLQVALRHPQRVAALLACDSPLAVDHPALVESVERRFRTVAAVSIEQRSLGRWFLEHHPERAALYAQINHFNPSAYRVPADEWRQAMLRLNEPQNLTPTQALAGLACPTLFLVGAEDPIVPVSAMRDLAQLAPGSEVSVIDNAAHSAYFEQAEVFNATVLDFLRRRL